MMHLENQCYKICYGGDVVRETEKVVGGITALLRQILSKHVATMIKTKHCRRMVSERFV